MNATEAKLLAFLQKSPQFVIPFYQRTYSLTDKQCQQLWDDMLCVETAPPVVPKAHKSGKAKADPLRGLFAATVEGKPAVVEYEPDSDLRDTEQVPLLEDGGIEAFIRREVLPYTPDAWIKEDANKIGYEVSFTRHFYKPQPLRSLEEISADILAIEKEAEGLLDGLLKVSAKP